jgi:hypothetical protein
VVAASDFLSGGLEMAQQSFKEHVDALRAKARAKGTGRFFEVALIRFLEREGIDPAPYLAEPATLEAESAG